MGAFFTNYQVRSDSSDDVRNSIAKLTKSSAFVSPPASGWVTVYEKASDDQDLDLLRQVLAVLVAALA